MARTKRQEEIVQRSIDLIAEHGMQYLTIKHIAQAIGVTEPALYRHFNSKFEILQAILNYFEEVSMAVKPAIDRADCSGLDKIELFLMDRYRLFARQPNLAKVLFNEEMFMHNERLSHRILYIMHEHRDLLTKAIRQGQQEKLIRTDIGFNSLFHVIVGSMRLLANRWCYSSFSFDIVSEGELLWKDLQRMITA